MPDDTPDIVDYSTFVRDLTESKISDVDIYGFGTEIELTYKIEAGDLRATKGVYSLSGDALLTKTLETQSIPFTTHIESYPLSKPWFDTMHIGSLIFFLIPIAMVWVILRQSKTIQSLGQSLSRMASANEGEKSSRKSGD